MESKRKNFLTILLIIIVVIIVGIIGYLGFELISEKIKENEAQTITDEFDSQIPTVTEDELDDVEELEGEQGSEETETGENQEENPGGSETTGGGSSSSGNGSGSSSGYYRGGSNSSYTTGVSIGGYWVVGTIRIPATGIKYSIFSQPSAEALERGTGMLYTTNGINQPGNTVIAGHNYRNRLFFSKNKNLVIGNIIYIKDVSGVEVAYAVTSKFVTTSTDSSFYQRDTGGKREITLTTCTDNGSKTGERLIILAREQ